MAKDSRLLVDPSVQALGVKALGFTRFDLDNLSPNPAFEAFHRETLTELKTRLIAPSLQQDPVLEGYRRLHAVLGKTGRRWISAPENLKQALLLNPVQAGPNRLVDLYNLVSLETGLAFGAHDLEKLDGDVHLRLTNGTESYWPIGSAEPSHVGAGEYAYCDGQEIICRMEIRQVEKTKVRPSTTNVFFIIQGHAGTPPEALGYAQSRLTGLLDLYCGQKK
jgi:DNA/RNA-binding domain of Phe-tRNA-synthetase-like protein